ncbi:conserved hypothetical protein [Frankia canadensis]|uniref:DUF2889 domain-containing protein n=1 Tax=Frankia canadensis TaxID=1836972 RepID=A0A2I2L2A1_9ACTN|nr:DUF2889 domain-containing protein [Frankia canadensis]SNQ52044.1 conserved hypothetical protein [Frankia canadensis]SOU59334.1 conserved hypothetical protein [Frankia canadensis]
MAAALLHRRSIDIEVYTDDDDDVFVVRTRLRDIRPWHPDADRVVMHDIELDLHVRQDDLRIVAVEPRMNAYPHAECPLINPNLQRLVGLSVRGGFTRALREHIGGAEGCAHLHELARTAGPAIMQATMGARAVRRLGVTLDPATAPPPRPAAAAAAAAPIIPGAATPGAAAATPAGGAPTATGAPTGEAVAVAGDSRPGGVRGTRTPPPPRGAEQASAPAAAEAGKQPVGPPPGAASCHIWASDGVASRKLAAGWIPGVDAYPAPVLAAFEQARQQDPVG